MNHGSRGSARYRLSLVLTVLLLTAGTCRGADRGAERGTDAAEGGAAGRNQCETDTRPITGKLRRASATSTPTTDIVVRPDDERGSVSPLVLGVNHRYPFNAFDSWDARVHDVNPVFLERFKHAGFTLIRFPGGRTANNYHWRRAIGPVDRRGVHVDSAFGRTPAYVEPLTNEFGSDEFGRVLDATGADGTIVVNFTTGTAREAADWVEYMNSPVGENPNGGKAWAAVRARNGHPEPYGIKYWEVGNELAGGKTFWLGDHATIVDKASKYAFGGSTRFTRQPAVRYADYSATASISRGKPKEVFFVKFPPVVPETVIVYVDGEAWTRVEDLQESGAENVYELNRIRGRIEFGDGARGNIPPKGAEVTVTHVSGRHDGFVDFYREMKAVDPSIRLGAAFNDPVFLQMMGSKHPYDVFVSHSYSFFHETPGNLNELHDLIVTLPDVQGAKIAGVKADIERYAGDRAEDIEVIVSEWAMSTGKKIGIQRVGAPAIYPQSLVGAVYSALVLGQWIELDVALAEKHSLVDIDPGSPPSGYDKPKSAFQALLGPYPCFVLSPSALVFRLFGEMVGDTRVAAEIIGNPSREIFTGEALSALVSTATTSADGSVSLVVINRDRTADVSSTIRLEGFEEKSATAWSLAGDAPLARNTVKHPNRMRIEEATIDDFGGELTFTFPALSVTAIKFVE